MVSSNSPMKPHSIVREGYFNGNISDQLRLYGPNFRPLPAKPTHEKYGLYIPEKPSLLVVSKLKGSIRLGPYGSNLYAAFTSYSQRENLEMIAEFESKTGILVPHQHTQLTGIAMLMKIVFDEIVRAGPGAMDILSNM